MVKEHSYGFCSELFISLSVFMSFAFHIDSISYSAKIARARSIMDCVANWCTLSMRPTFQLDFQLNVRKVRRNSIYSSRTLHLFFGFFRSFIHLSIHSSKEERKKKRAPHLYWQLYLFYCKNEKNNNNKKTNAQRILHWNKTDFLHRSIKNIKNNETSLLIRCTNCSRRRKWCSMWYSNFFFCCKK